LYDFFRAWHSLARRLQYYLASVDAERVATVPETKKLNKTAASRALCAQPSGIANESDLLFENLLQFQGVSLLGRSNSTEILTL
jgi:hypothetical protein